MINHTNIKDLLPKRRPLSAQLMVIYLINSSKHYAYNSSLFGQIPVSLASLLYNSLSSFVLN